jgi:hypothetical protein
VKRAHALLAAVTGVLASPALALACPVCFSAKNEATRIAFLGTTVFLTALPLFLIGGVGLWLARRVEQAEREHAELAGTTTPVLKPVPPTEQPLSASGPAPALRGGASSSAATASDR